MHVAKNISRRCDWYEIKIVRDTRKGAKIGTHYMTLKCNNGTKISIIRHFVPYAV